MKSPYILIAGSVLALGANHLLAPPGYAEEERTTLNQVDKNFIENEAAGAQALVAIALEATSTGERAAIRAFARILVHDHTKWNATLSKLATSKGVELRSVGLSRGDNRLNEIRQLEGEAFDREFVALMIEMHTQTVRNFEKTANNTPDLDLKNWATNTLPRLKGRLERAKELSSSRTASADSYNTIVL